MNDWVCFRFITRKHLLITRRMLIFKTEIFEATLGFGLVWLCEPWILRSSDGISHFSGIFPLAQGGLNPLLQDGWSSKLPGIREGSYSQFNPNTT